MQLPESCSDLPIETLTIFGDPSAFASSGFVTCVPARDEAGFIGRCLAALDRELRLDDGVILVANGCTDETVPLARAAMADWSRPHLLLDCRWRPGAGSAPLARRLALDLALSLAPEAILFSTDSDTIVGAGLRTAYADAFAQGFDLVCGAIAFLPEEAARLPPADPTSEATIAEYRELSREIAALLRPDPDNPWPHHGNIGGANFAMRSAAYRTAGPLPAIVSGEDRALRRRFEAHGLRVRYCDTALVETSCRLDGRAPGGLSQELARNRSETDPEVDELLEPPETLLLRWRTRNAFLDAPDAAARSAIARSLGLGEEEAEAISGLPAPLAWHAVEERSPSLRRARLRLSDLRRHLPALRRARDSIR